MNTFIRPGYAHAHIASLNTIRSFVSIVDVLERTSNGKSLRFHFNLFPLIEFRFCDLSNVMI